MILSEEGRTFHNKEYMGRASIFHKKFTGFGRSIQTSFLKVKRSYLYHFSFAE